MTEAEYREAWKLEIETGVEAGKLELEGRKADLRTVAMAVENEEQNGARAE